MSLFLHDTATRSTREFTPIAPGKASIYVCGATVQGVPHIGHMRGGLNFDVLRRWLTRGGLDVALVRNVTDIDDKILTKAAAAGRPWWEWAATHERAFQEAYSLLGCLPASVEPRATGHITQMVTLMERLIAAGSAYAAEGNVYFAVSSSPEYGALSGQKPDDVQQGEEGVAGKRDSRDFTLWKAAKPGEPSWPTPWGAGRPGWHLECSAMAEAYLGAEFDIHGGGIDLIFPHHENEQAQSRAAGDGFARYWLHNAWVTMSGEKMAKSLGNTVSIPEMVQRVRPQELRYYLVGPHYRSNIEYSEEALAEAEKAYQRVESFLGKVAGRTGSVDLGELPAGFTAAMDDDLSTPAALAEVHTAVRAGNRALDSGDDAGARAAAGAVRSMMDVLGLDPASWPGPSSDSRLRAALDDLIGGLLDERQRARSERDFALADAIRDRLLGAGVSVEDTPDGPKWTLKDE